jgi:hypothetical protein
VRKQTVVVVLLVVVVFAASVIALERLQVGPPGNVTTTQSTGVSTTNQSALLASCSQGHSPQDFPTILANGSQPAVICFRLYYYNPNATTTLDVGHSLVIEGSLTAGSFFSGAANFTVEASQSQLVMGGPGNENEGATVAYAITATRGASGSYELAFSGGDYWMSPLQEPEECPYFGELVAGSGQPNYVQPTGCITYAVTSTTYTVSGMPYALLGGYVYFQVVSLSNSTQV